MLIRDIINETTSSGGIATVAQPMNSNIIKRPGPVVKKKKKKAKEGTRCWKGYEKKGTKKMFGKTVPNCVKKEGKSPHKKGTKKYKKHMAAMHAG
tara:strand:+ start:1181 stop:1465 length:285 start_codon:yes stop_codon:yes gene_type:complete